MRFATAVVAVLFLPAVGLAEVRVDKVEPPNWWVGMKHNHVQLMVYGNDLGNLQVEFADPRLNVQAVHAAGNPHYAFVDFEIPTDLPADQYALDFRRGGEHVQINYPLLQRQLDETRHQGFDSDDVIYLITPDRFANGDKTNDRAADVLDEFDRSNSEMRHGGDLQGIMDRLEYLQRLGVTTIWLNPVLENRGVNSYHGYKATNLYRIDPRLGSNATYREFVQAAHRHGLKVIFDHVSNHIGLRHPWLDDLPMTDWINGSVESHLSHKHYLLSVTDPHADSEAERMLKSFWFVDSMPDLNQTNRFVANYLIQNTLWWIETTGLDGIREDTYPYADQAYLGRWAQTILREYPDFNIVGEIWAAHPAFIAQFQRESKLQRRFETHLPAVMDFPLANALRGFLSGQGGLADVYAVYAQDFLYADPDNLLVFLDNHDMSRAIFAAEGNDPRRVRVALTILLTSRGIPQILYGTEINMLGGSRHVELRADFPGGFPGDRRNAFTRAGRSSTENEMFEFLSKLLAVRRDHSSLRRGKMIHDAPTWNSDVYKILRIDGDDKILIIANGQNEPRRVDLSELAHRLKGTRFLLDLLNQKRIEWDGRSRLEMEPLTAHVYQLIE